MVRRENILIHPFSDTNLNRLTDLCNSTYEGREISDGGYLNWEYNKNPDGKALISVAEKDSEIVAQYLVLPRKFSIDDKIINGSVSVNTLTRPGYKGLGLFTNLTSEIFKLCREKEIEFTIGFPNPTSLPVIEKKKIFETAGYLPFLIKPLNPLKSFIKFISKKGDNTGKEIELKISENIINESNGISVLNFRDDSDSYNRFINEFNRQKQNVTFRSIDFMKWRYIDIPLRKYYHIKFTVGDEIKAIAIYRSRYVFGLRCCILVDFISIDNGNGLANILKMIKKISIDNTIDLMIATVPVQFIEYSSLRRAGFFSVPQKFLPQKLAVIIQRHLPNCSVNVSDFKRWFLTFGDYDIF